MVKYGGGIQIRGKITISEGRETILGLVPPFAVRSCGGRGEEVGPSHYRKASIDNETQLSWEEFCFSGQ